MKTAASSSSSSSNRPLAVSPVSTEIESLEQLPGTIGDSSGSVARESDAPFADPPPKQSRSPEENQHERGIMHGNTEFSRQTSPEGCVSETSDRSESGKEVAALAGSAQRRHRTSLRSNLTKASHATSARRTSLRSNLTQASQKKNLWSSEAISQAIKVDAIEENDSHPLCVHAPEAVLSIDFIKLDHLEMLLRDPAPLPRRQELPDDAFQELTGNCMLLAISHAWFFQRHPDPTGDKKKILLKLILKIRIKYPNDVILAFLDFCSLSQPPFQPGQERRTVQEKADFNHAVQHMHFCYLFADVLIHLHSDAPDEDYHVQEAAVSTTHLEVEQVGSMVQVCGASEDLLEKTPLPYDIIIDIDGEVMKHTQQLAQREKGGARCMWREGHAVTYAEMCHDLSLAELDEDALNAIWSRLQKVRRAQVNMRYYVRPYGMINSTPIDLRGWIFFERFTTMLRAAMVDASTFDNIVFTNSEQTRTLLRDGSMLLSGAASTGGNDGATALANLRKVLKTFGDELAKKVFSASSTDKMTNDAGFKASNDADVVAALMQDLVDHYAENWYHEQEKQRAITGRFKAEVPLLVLIPRSWRDAIISLEPAVVLCVIVLGSVFASSLVAAVALVANELSAKRVAIYCGGGIVTFFWFGVMLSTPQSDFGVSNMWTFLNYAPIFVVVAAVGLAGVFLIFEVEPNWQESSAMLILAQFITLLILTLAKTLDLFVIFSTEKMQTRYRVLGRRLPGNCKKLIKALRVAGVCYLIFAGTGAYIQGCIALRLFVAKQSVGPAVALVLAACVSKLAFMQVIVQICLPKMKANLPTTDSILFMVNVIITFGTRLVLTALRSVGAVVVVAIVTSLAELTLSTALVEHTHRKMKRIEDELLDLDAKAALPRGSSGTPAHLHAPLATDIAPTVMGHATTIDMNGVEMKRSEAMLILSKQLIATRQQLSTEIIHLVNDFFAEFFCTAATVICGMVFRESTVVTLLNNELEWHQLPIFFAASYLPEIADGWFIMVYLRRLGVDWRAIGHAARSDAKWTAQKVCATMAYVFYILLVALGKE